MTFSDTTAGIGASFWTHIHTHTKEHSLVTFSDTTAGIGASFRTDPRRRTDGGGRTDRRGSQNSYLDIIHILQKICSNFSKNGVF